MGWNSGYAIFESTVIGVYNLGVLDKKLLEVLMAPYRGTDIDSGGSKDLESIDGKTVEQIVIETGGLTFPQKPTNDEELEYYYEEIYDKMAIITKRFNK